jgi:hypothetical protein
MFKQKIFIASFIVLILVAVLNYLGSIFNLYWVYRWYDIPMHILGGLWVALFSLSIFAYFCKNISIVNYRKKVFGIVFIILLFITISWEIFELWGGITFLGDRGYWIDSSADILNAYLGGTIACLLFIKKRKCNNNLVNEGFNNNQIK